METGNQLLGRFDPGLFVPRLNLESERARVCVCVWL